MSGAITVAAGAIARARFLGEALAVLVPGGPQAQASAERIADRLANPNLAPPTAWELGVALAALAPASSGDLVVRS